MPLPLHLHVVSSLRGYFWEAVATPVGLGAEFFKAAFGIDHNGWIHLRCTLDDIEADNDNDRKAEIIRRLKVHLNRTRNPISTAQQLVYHVFGEERDRSGELYIKHMGRVANLVVAHTKDRTARLEKQVQRLKLEPANDDTTAQIVSIRSEMKDRKSRLRDDITVAWLHDLLERKKGLIFTDDDLRNIGFNEYVVTNTLALTRDKSVPYFDYVVELSKNKDAVRIKRADMDDNSRITRNPHMPPSSQQHELHYKYWLANAYLHDVEEGIIAPGSSFKEWFRTRQEKMSPEDQALFLAVAKKYSSEYEDHESHKEKDLGISLTLKEPCLAA